MKRLAILTSGGDAPGMNAAVRAVLNKATNHGIEVVGIKYGILGLICSNFVELDQETVDNAIATGGTILFSSRLPEFEQREVQEKALQNLREANIDALIMIGGDGSYYGALGLAKLGFPVICIPATIDNDVPGTEMCIGFDTAINTVMSSLDKIRDTANSHVRAFIIEIRGLKAGDLALWSGVAGGAEYIVIPEEKVDIQDLVAKMRASIDRGKKHCLIVLSEGVMKAAELSKQIKEIYPEAHTRAVELGYVPRGGSPTPYDRVLASKMASIAVDLFLEENFGTCVAMQKERLVVLDLQETMAKKETFTDLSLYPLNQTISF